jgi:hypothetical protein
MSGELKVLPKKLEDEMNRRRALIGTYRDEGSFSTQTPPLSIEDCMNDSVERHMFQELLGPLYKPPGQTKADILLNNALRNNRENRTPALPTSSTLLERNESKSDLQGEVIDRLTGLEGEVKSLRRQLAQEVLKSEQLEMENKGLKKMQSSGGQSKATLDCLVKADKENQRLRDQIKEMEAFLEDYGLVWIGNDDVSAEADSKDSAEKTLESSEKESVTDYNLFIRKIEELNRLIASEPTEIVKESSGNGIKARLVNPDELREHVPLTIYSNGLMIMRGPFRFSGTNSHDSFVRDIIDGYFPAEFKLEHPDGLIFDIKDKRGTAYSGSSDEGKMTSDEFLRRLPKTLMAKGEINSIRGDIESRLHIPADERTAEGDREIILTTEASNSGSDENLASINIKWMDGKRVIKAKFFASDLIGEVKEAIKKHFGGFKCDDFDLRSAYPPRVLLDFTTLQEAGLVPNGTLHARKKN